MSVYMIPYELHHDKDYQKIHNGIKSLGGCIHCLRSIWFVKTGFSIPEMHEILKGYIDKDDSLLIMKTSHEWDSMNLPAKCKSWLKHHS